MESNLRIEGSIFGLLAGNALGSRCIDKKLSRAVIAQQLARQYSESGAMTLCTMASLIDSERIDPEDIANRFHEWYIGSYLAAGERIQSRVTVSQALRVYINGMPPDRCGAKKTPADNAALMRMLPIALWNASQTLETIVQDAHEISKFTNQQIIAQVCSALYCLIIRRFLLGGKERATEVLSAFYREKGMEAYNHALDKFQGIAQKPGRGTEEVCDSLWTASSIFANNSKNFEQAVSEAILRGNDIEVTGAVVGSIAGTALGINDIPQRWLNQLDLSNEAKSVISSFVREIKKRN